MVNAFWLDRDVGTAATWLVDSHVTSSVFECSMVLTTAVQRRGLSGDDLYFTHPDHPLTRWAADAYGNWRRLRDYVEAVHDEWRHRWDHGPDERHACWATVESVDQAAVRDFDWPSADPSDPPQVTGQWEAPDYVDAYRYYYANDKRHLFEWSGGRGEPPWIEEYTVGNGDGPDESNGAPESGESG